MKPRQRAFIHSIAEDFGFDGESLDPEPHRHVVLFKTPKFVAAPMKTLAQAARIRKEPIVVSAAVEGEQSQKRADEANDFAWNGLLLRNPRFALTEDELTTELLKAAPNIEFEVHFVSNSDTVALLPRHGPDDQVYRTQQLISVLTPISTAITKARLGTSVVLAEYTMPEVSAPTSGTSTPSSLHAAELKLIRQSDAMPTNPGSTGGWSQVAARRSAAPKAPVVETIGQKPMYTVLGSRLAEAKRRKQEEAELAKKREELAGEAVDDWSAEMEEDDNATGSHDVDLDTAR